ncbi:MAG: AgmX/PglI C-terminal domain-containing protein [Sandaracinus sp.]
MTVLSVGLGSNSVAACAIALCSSVALAGCGSAPPSSSAPQATVATAELVRGTMTLSRDGNSEAVAGPLRVETGQRVETGADGRGSLSLDSGAWALVDRSSALTLELGRVQLESGRIWIDASQSDETVIDTAALHLVAHDATLAVAISEGVTSVYVGSGEVAYTAVGASGDGAEGTVAQGESLRATAGQAPTLAPEAMWDDWTGGLADPARTRLRTVEPIGVLAGRRLDEIGVARSPLPIRSHDVSVAITGDLATTQITQIFFNARSDMLEGEWAIRIPRGAIVQSFEIDRGNGFESATPAAVGLGASYSLLWMGPELQEARLAYDGPERLRARIHPIMPGASVAVRLRYTEWLDRIGNRRTYVYPMRGDGEPPLLSELVLDVDLAGAGGGPVRAGMGAVTENGHVVLRVPDARPQADFVLDLFDAAAPTSTGAHIYSIGSGVGRLEDTPAEGREAYALFDIPTEGLGALETPDASAPTPLELVLLLDVSGATDPEDLEVARAVVESVLRQLAPDDRVTLRLADVRAHVPEGGTEELTGANDATREAMLASIARVDLGGATDLGQSLREAASLVAGRPRGAVLYLGDALPTTGALDATAIRAVLASIDAPPRFFGLAIGETANVDLLRALFGEAAAQVRDREGASRRVMGMLADAARPTLRGVTVDLGEGIERVYPRGPLTLPVGSHLRLVGRQAGDSLPRTITIRGSRDGRAFEQTLEAVSSTLDDHGDVRRRWAVARLGELIDEDAGREALVDLGIRFGIVTPWTSLALGGVATVPIPIVYHFDRDPIATPWSLGGGAGSVRAIDLGDADGWRRRVPSSAAAPLAAPESTWEGRVPATVVSGASSGDGGLALAAAERTLREGERGPRQCYERRAIVRPDLRGNVTVQVTVGPDGAVRESRVASSDLSDDDVEHCVATEVRGLAFPATEGATVTVTHTFSFQVPEREFGGRRECSTASSQPLEVRRQLWQERLDNVPSDLGAVLEIYRQARAQCELSTWRARRTLLDLALARFPSLQGKVELVRALSGDPTARAYLHRVILRFVSSPDQVRYVRSVLGLEPQVEWLVFARLWQTNTSPEVRLRLVRRWLEVAPDDLDLRLRLLSLLEQTSALPEARRVARELRADPLSDAKVRTEVGEFWLRQNDEAEARRVFSEIVEHTPLDPWARQRLGDLYRAHGWYDDAYREYRTLSVLRPDDGEVLLLLARAAAGAGRIDEALRLEQRLAESTDPGDDAGAAASARLWSWLRLSELAATADDEALRADARRRMRENGVLRDPPAMLVAITFDHPDDAITLRVRHPTFDPLQPFEPAELGAVSHGLVAMRIGEREDGEYRFQLIRGDRENLRDQVCTLTVIVAPGTADERRIAQEVTLPRTEPVKIFALTADGRLVAGPTTP